MPMSTTDGEKIEYNGIVYKRHHNYYCCSTSAAKKAGVERFLHRAIYCDNKGTIPQGWQVHHRDGNPLNNDPHNLEALPEWVHIDRHRGIM